ncbi:alpha/beta hydrolase [Fodinicurvata sp. EGI_FJ10296]|uniref:alpha/beta fold hydrolase n=1 Tax=Fodinicurvata sp. EGI_FJ10296 TaxID=3231908 RepID=UPI0034551B08
MTSGYTSTLERPDGGVLTYDVVGDGPPLVLISGLGGTSAFWKPFSAHLSDRFTVLSFDQPGIARSRRGKAACTIAQFANDVLALMDHVFPGQTATVMGHSMGGAVAQTLAATQPARIARLILSGTWLETDAYMRAQFEFRRALLDRAPELHAGFQRLLSRSPDRDGTGVGAGAWDGLIEPNHGMTAAAVATYNERVAAILDFSGKTLAPRLTMPCLVLGVRDDQVVPFHHQRDVHAAIPGSTLSTLDYGGHFYPNARPDATAGLVLEWLDSL